MDYTQRDIRITALRNLEHCIQNKIQVRNLKPQAMRDMLMKPHLSLVAELLRTQGPQIARLAPLQGTLFLDALADRFDFTAMLASGRLRRRYRQ